MNPAEGFDPSTLEAVQLEDGSTAYIHHPVAVPADSAILAVQTEVGLEELAAEDEEGFTADTVVALEQYASKVRVPGSAKTRPPTPRAQTDLGWTWPKLWPPREGVLAASQTTEMLLCACSYGVL